MKSTSTCYLICHDINLGYIEGFSKETGKEHAGSEDRNAYKESRLVQQTPLRYLLCDSCSYYFLEVFGFLKNNLNQSCYFRDTKYLEHRETHVEERNCGRTEWNISYQFHPLVLSAEICALLSLY